MYCKEERVYRYTVYELIHSDDDSSSTPIYQWGVSDVFDDEEDAERHIQTMKERVRSGEFKETTGLDIRAFKLEKHVRHTITIVDEKKIGEAVEYHV